MEGGLDYSDQDESSDEKEEEEEMEMEENGGSPPVPLIYTGLYTPETVPSPFVEESSDSPSESEVVEVIEDSRSRGYFPGSNRRCYL